MHFCNDRTEHLFRFFKKNRRYQIICQPRRDVRGAEMIPVEFVRALASRRYRFMWIVATGAGVAGDRSALLKTKLFLDELQYRRHINKIYITVHCDEGTSKQIGWYGQTFSVHAPTLTES